MDQDLTGQDPAQATDTKANQDTGDVQAQLAAQKAQIEQLMSQNQGMKEKISGHNKEMVAKKEAKRDALAKAEAAAAEAQNYQEALKLRKQQDMEWQTERAAFETLRQTHELERKQYQVMLALQGQIAPNFKAETVARLLPISSMEVGEDGKIVNLDTHIKTFLTNEPGFKPSTVNGAGAGAQAIGTGGLVQYSKEAQLVAVNSGMPIHQVEEQLKSDNFRKMAERNKWLTPKLDLSYLKQE